MKIFLTGSSGFLGSHLVPRLKEQHEVHCMQSDLLDFSSVITEVHRVKPNIVIHLAARTEVAWSFNEPASFSSVNYAGSVNLIEAALGVDCFEHFVFASTMEVYGWQDISDRVRAKDVGYSAEAFNEKTPCHPNAPYAVAKYAVEQYLDYAARVNGLRFTALRQTNAYGRTDNDFFVTEQIISQIVQVQAGKKDAVTLGDPRPLRNFIYVDDVVNAYTAVVDNLGKLTGRNIFCLGPNNPITIENWYKLIADKMNYTGPVEWYTKPERPGEVFYLNSTNQRITQLLHWEPKVSYNQGLEQTIHHWR